MRSTLAAAAFLQHDARHWTDFHWWTAERASVLVAGIAALTTVAALLLTLLLLRRQLDQFRNAEIDRDRGADERRERQEAKEREPAERFVAWLEQDFRYDPDARVNIVTISLKNAGTTPIFGCAAYLVDALQTLAGSDAEEDTLCVFESVVAPGERMRAEASRFGDKILIPAVEVRFTDPAGRKWTRDTNGTLRSWGNWRH